MTSPDKEILHKIQHLLNSQPKYFFWVPIVTLFLGAGLALFPKLFTKTEKYALDELCTICYSQNRSIVTEPCGHVVLCHACAGMVYACPFCRAVIGDRVALGRYISE